MKEDIGFHGLHISEKLLYKQLSLSTVHSKINHVVTTDHEHFADRVGGIFWRCNKVEKNAVDIDGYIFVDFIWLESLRIYSELEMHLVECLLQTFPAYRSDYC